MLDLIQNTLLCALAAAAGNPTETSIPEGLDWKSLRELAKAQGVLAVALDGLDAMASNGCRVPLFDPQNRMERIEWLKTMGLTESRYARQEKNIASLSQSLSDRGVEMLLLKGYGLSQNYPLPAHRQSGDIDIFLFGQSDVCDEMVKADGISVDDSGPHHSVFKYNGDIVENHYVIMDQESHKSNRILNELIASRPEDCRRLDVPGGKVLMLSPDAQALHLIRHAGQHFAVENITLRHVLDWAFFVRRFGQEVNWQKVYADCDALHCRSFLDCLNAVCADVLGFEGPLFRSGNVPDQLRDRMLAEIFSPEFTDDGGKNGRFLSFALFKTRRILANSWKYRMVYKESLLRSYVNLSVNRLKHLKSR